MSDFQIEIGNFEDLEESQKLLWSWGFQPLMDIFESRYIDLQCFKIMNYDDLNELIDREMLGLRIKFRQKLIEWRTENVSLKYFFL